MIRKAKITDTKSIYTLISFWAKQGKVLGRSLNYLYENIRDFWVFEEKNKIVACCALHIVGWQELGEIKSLVVAKNFQQRSIGSRLVSQCLEEARSLGIKKVFALTFAPKFFKKLKFQEIKMQDLPHKIWSDCVDCVYFPNCKEKAVIIKI
jgi:amino-acid N-acetyltransferase